MRGQARGLSQPGIKKQGSGRNAGHASDRCRGKVDLMLRVTCGRAARLREGFGTEEGGGVTEYQGRGKSEMGKGSVCVCALTCGP